MTITQSAIQTAISRAMPRSSGLVILFVAVHTVSDAVTNMLSELLPTLQDRFSLTETMLALLVATLSLSALITQPFGLVTIHHIADAQICSMKYHTRNDTNRMKWSKEFLQ